MEESPRKIQNASVAVIGGAGFLGSHLVDHLINDRECSVLVLDNLVSGKLKFVHEKAKFLHFDITGSEADLLQIFRKYNIEYVFNYAAEPYVPFSFERPLHVFNVNAFGALKVINAAQEAGVKGILQVSSAEIYGDAAEEPIDEYHRANPHSTYGASKLAIDTLVRTRFKEAETPVIALRQFNCIGERETHPYVVTEIIGQLAETGNVKLGNNSFRDFQYAGDAVRMAVELLEKGKFGHVYNMGSEHGVKIYDLAEMIANAMDKVLYLEHDEARARPWEIWHLQSNNAKLYKTISYRPKTDLKEALQLTIKYYQENGNAWDF